MDFGACRDYSKEFIDKYIEVINGASEGDRNKVLTLSREMGFLTGYESKVNIYMFKTSCILIIIITKLIFIFIFNQKDYGRDTR